MLTPPPAPRREEKKRLFNEALVDRFRQYDLQIFPDGSVRWIENPEEVKAYNDLAKSARSAGGLPPRRPYIPKVQASGGALLIAAPTPARGSIRTNCGTLSLRHLACSYFIERETIIHALGVLASIDTPIPDREKKVRSVAISPTPSPPLCHSNRTVRFVKETVTTRKSG